MGDEFTFVIDCVYAISVGQCVTINKVENAATSALHERLADIKRRNYLAMLRMDANLSN